MNGPLIRPAARNDTAALVHLRHGLWPELSIDEHAAELASFFDGRCREPLAILVAEDSERELQGFCELSIRAYAEGCTSDQVGYLEAWYVAPDGRGRGVGRALIEAAEDWARFRGCTEFASDTEHDNGASAAAHQALGFSEVGLIRCFRKDL
jgi:aminoglycoside 6'-N-acetyltransferase I